MSWSPADVKQGKIPEQLRSGDFRFILIGTGRKEPIERDWNTSAFYSFFSHRLRKHLIEGGNYGILCGPGNLIVIDADKPKFIEIIKEKLPPTFTVKTGSGQGLHFYYICPNASFNNFAIDGEHVGELRAPKSGEENVYFQCVGPGSVHPSGGIYAIENNVPIAHIELRVLWDIVGRYVATKEEKKKAKRKGKQRDTKPEGGPKFDINNIPGFPWNLEEKSPDDWQGPHPIHGSTTGENLHITGNQWYCHRCKCGGGPLSMLAITEHIVDCKDHSNEDTIELSKEEIGGTIQRAIEIGLMEEEQKEEEEERASSFHLTDLGNTHRFVQRFGKDIKYCHDWGQWFEWDDIKWNRDNTGAIMRKAKVVALSIYAEASNARDQERRRALASHAVKTESEARLNAMMNLSKSEIGVPVVPEDFDKNPWLLNCKNGTVDLRTGKLHPHNRDDFITKSISIAYSPNAKCPRWNRFLIEITNDNKDLVAFIKRAIGYSLTGSTQEQMFFLLYGTGANGKTTLIETLSAMFNDYSATANTDVFMAQKRGVPNDIARLRGARFVSAVETEADRYLAESLVKLVTGGDTIAARFLFHEFFEFTPNFKLWLATNHKPMVKGTDHALWRRIMLIPFEVKFDPKTEPTLKETLLSELPGILAESVQEAMKWYDEGISPPNEVLLATKEYHDEMDVLGDFIDSLCAIENNACERAALLYVAYSEWCEIEKERPVSKRAFGGMLKDRGFRSKRTSTHRYWWGIRLKSTPKQESISDDNYNGMSNNVPGKHQIHLENDTTHEEMLFEKREGIRRNIFPPGLSGNVGGDASHDIVDNREKSKNMDKCNITTHTSQPPDGDNGNVHDNTDFGTYDKNHDLRLSEKTKLVESAPDAAIENVTHFSDANQNLTQMMQDTNFLLIDLPKNDICKVKTPGDTSIASKPDVTPPHITSQISCRFVRNPSIIQQEMLKCIMESDGGVMIEKDIVIAINKHEKYVHDAINELEKMGYVQRDKQDPTKIWLVTQEEQHGKD